MTLQIFGPFGVVFIGYISMTRSNTVAKYLIGRSYKDDECDWLFPFRSLGSLLGISFLGLLNSNRPQGFRRPMLSDDV